MKIEIWSDFSCPFCYIGEVRLKKALSNLGLLDKVDLVFHSYELNTNAKRHEGADLNKLIAEKYNITYEEAKKNNDRIVKMAEKSGLNYDFTNITTNNTNLAHQALKAAESFGCSELMVEKLFEAYFTKGLDLGDINVLLSLGEEVGLNKDQLRTDLENKTFKDLVEKDEQRARELSISGVPYFLINGSLVISGAVSVKSFTESILSVKE